MKVNLCSNVVYFQSSDSVCFIYLSGQNKGYRVNATVCKVLELCNGKLCEDEIVRSFDLTLQAQLSETIAFLKSEHIIQNVSTLPHALKLCEIDTFYLSLTQRCNLNCRFCLKNTDVSYKHELSTDEWLKVITEISVFNNQHPKTLYFTGGEPLLQPGFCEIYRHAIGLGHSIYIFTNGTLLSKQLCELFSRLPPKAMMISVDGSNAKLHETLRGVKGSFSHVLDGTRNLIEYSHQVVIWQCVVSRDNLYDMENIVKLALDMGVQGIRFSVATRIGLGSNVVNYLSSDELFFYYCELFRLEQAYSRCISINKPANDKDNALIPLGSMSCGIGNVLHIDSSGGVTPCYGLTTPAYTIKKPESFSYLDLPWEHEFFNKSTTDYLSCSTCGIRNICNGGCKAEIQEICGSIDGCNREKKAALIRFLEHFLFKQNN